MKMRASTALASFALAASTPFLSVLTSANPIPIGEIDLAKSGVQLADPQPPNFQIPGQDQGQINIRILTYRPDTIDVDPPKLESINIDLDPSSYTGEAEFAPIQLVAATVSQSTYPVSCAFSLQDGTTDDSWVLDSQEKRTFIPRAGSLQGVTAIRCGKLDKQGLGLVGGDGQMVPQKQGLTIGGGEDGTRVPDMFAPPVMSNKALSEAGNEAGNEQQQLEKAFAKSDSGLAAKTNDSPFPPFSPGPLSPTTAGPARDGSPYITYLVPQGISGKVSIEISLNEEEDGALTGRVFWDDDGTAARILQGIWYNGPMDAHCQLINTSGSVAPKQSRAQGLNEPVVAIGVQCWTN